MSSHHLDITTYGFSIVQIETMSLCNMRCDFCAYPLRHNTGKVLPDEKVISIMDSLSRSDGFQYICLSQFNEPLLDQRIYGFIKHARQRGLPVMVVTNGLPFKSGEVAKQLVEAGPDYVKVSLQVMNAAMFAGVRKAGSDFEAYRRGICDFLKIAQYGQSEVTLDIACNFLSLTGRLKKICGFEYGDPSVYNTVDDLREDTRRFLKEIEQCVASYAFDGNIFDAFLREAGSNYAQEPGLGLGPRVTLKIKPFIYGRRITEFYPVKKSRPCNSKILGVLADGCVVPCCMAYDNSLSLGNIHKDPLHVILESSSGLLDSIRVKGERLPAACQHCLGAPTRRGAWLKKMRFRIGI